MQSGMKIKTIVTALDGSDHSDKALDFAADLAAKYGARLVLINVLSDKPMSADERHIAAVEYQSDILDKLDASPLIDVRGDPRAVDGLLIKQYAEAAHQMRQIIGTRLLDDACIKARNLGVENVETVVKEGDPAKLILETARSLEANLIILGCRGLGDLMGLLMGSVSHKVSGLAECTCITVK